MSGSLGLVGSGVDLAAAGTVSGGTYTSGISLTNPASQDPLTIAAAGYVTNRTSTYSGDAVHGASNASWSITNLGTIKGEGSLGHGVNLGASGVIVNYGLIANDTTANPTHYQDAAIAIHGSDGTVLNAGTILNAGLYDGVRLNAGGNVSNNAGALIEGGRAGIEILTDAGTVANSGDIISNTTGTGSAAVYLQDGGLIANEATGVIAATALPGIRLEAGGRLVNYGTIESTGSFGVYVGSGFVATVANLGTIIGNGGAVAFTGDGDLLIVNPGAVFVGGLAGAGSDAIELAAGSTTGRFSFASVVGFDAATIDAGAKWQLSGDADGSSSRMTGRY